MRAEKLGELAGEFDAIHSVERAVEVGSVDRIISAAELRPYLIDAVERGVARSERERELVSRRERGAKRRAAALMWLRRCCTSTEPSGPTASWTPSPRCSRSRSAIRSRPR